MDLHIVLVDYPLKTKEEYKNWDRRFKRYLSIKLDKAYFQHDIAYEDFKDLARGTASLG